MIKAIATKWATGKETSEEKSQYIREIPKFQVKVFSPVFKKTNQKRVCLYIKKQNFILEKTKQRSKSMNIIQY